MNKQRKQLEEFANNFAPYVNEGVKIILAIFLLVGLVLSIIYAILSISFPYPLDYGEAPLVDQAIRLAAGENIYRSDIATPPYAIANYPPLYVLSLVPVLNLLESPFHLGRLISTLAALGTAVFLGMTVYTLTKDRWASLVTGLFFLAVPYVIYWAGLARIDLLALAFATGALFVLARWPRSWGGLVGGGLLLMAAAYTRQSYALAAPLAGFAWLWTQDRRKAFLLAGLVGGLGVLLFVLLNALTAGGFFYNIITANVNEFGFERLSNHLEGLGEVAPIGLALGGLFLFAGWRGGPAWPLFGAFFLGASISALTVGKIGSNVNYFLELAAAFSLVGGAVLVWSKPYPWRNTLVTFLLALQIGLFLRNTMDVRFGWHLIPRTGDLGALRRLENMVEAMERPVLGDEYMGMLTILDRPLYIQPFEVTQLAAAGLWDQGPLLSDLAAQAFDGVLIHHFDPFPVYQERWSPAMLAEIEANYRPVRTLAGTVVYIPVEARAVSQVPSPDKSTPFDPTSLAVGPVQAIGKETFVGEPFIAVNPIDPDRLAAIFTSVSKYNCDLPFCKITLRLYLSDDGGETWSGQSPFTQEQEAMLNGVVAFDSQGTLYVLGIRDGIITLNFADGASGYEMSRKNSEQLTAAQVRARPWLRIHPVSGVPYVSMDAQEEDFTFVTPSLLRPIGDMFLGSPLNRTFSRADQHIAIEDVFSRRRSMPDDIQVLFGKGDNLSLVWTWGTAPWVWPRTVWMANSTDGGVTFGEPLPILETWGPINSVYHDGTFAIVYRAGREEFQHLAVATTGNNGVSWRSAIASGDIPLYFDVDKAAGINYSPDGTLDLVFYAHDPGSRDCVWSMEAWANTQPFGRIDPCSYNVFYTFSEDGGRTFSQPIQLNSAPIRGESFVTQNGTSLVGSHIAVASSDAYAHPIWIGTPGQEKTQVYTVRIAR